MKAKKRQPKKKYKSIDLKAMIENNNELRIKGEKKDADNPDDDESDEESPMNNMMVTDI